MTHHDDVKEDKDEDLRKGHAGSESEFEEKERSSNSPIDVSTNDNDERVSLPTH